MSDITLSITAQAQAAEEAEEAFTMDEESFRAFYVRTARPLWCYLSRALGNAASVDDILQESYYRFLRARLPVMNEAHRKNYLFRIATNLLRDHWRRAKGEYLPDANARDISNSTPLAERVQQESDLSRALEGLKPRERVILWLAYVEGSSHKEIAEHVGLKADSVRPMLFRARQRLADLLRKRGLGA